MKRFRIRKIRKGFFLTVFLKKHGNWLVWELRRFFVPLSVFLAIIGALIIISATNLTWDGWKMTHGFPKTPFCEHAGNGTVKQPLNTWSSLFFIPIGLWAMRRAVLDKVSSSKLSPVRRHKRYGYFFGGALILTGLGSWMFHASMTYVGHFVDVTGMYFLGGFLFTYGISRKSRQSATGFTLLYALIVLPLVAFQWFNPQASRYAFGALILIALSVEIIWHKSFKNSLFIWAIVTLGLGFGIWILDEKRLLCSPQNCFFQGHAVWHILTAVSTQFSYLYYLSEAPRINPKIGYRPGRYKALLRG